VLQMTLAAEPNLDKLPSLTDIAADDPLRSQLEVVLSNGWMSGAETFDSERAVTRKEWALASKALIEGFRGVTLSKSATLNDLAGVDETLADAARLSVGEGWLSAEQGRFDPEATVSRGEVAQTLAKVSGLTAH
ncbi:MAG TPA: cyanophycinase, partial [Pseudomonas sp.]|nr:cyanophycinase [Pseudomonas sp.]